MNKVIKTHSISSANADQTSAGLVNFSIHSSSPPYLSFEMFEERTKYSNISTYSSSTCCWSIGNISNWSDIVSNRKWSSNTFDSHWKCFSTTRLSSIWLSNIEYIRIYSSTPWIFQRFQISISCYSSTIITS